MRLPARPRALVRPRTLTTVLLAVLALLLAGCGGSSDDNGGGSSGGSDDQVFKISAANYTEAAPLFRVIHTNLDDAIKKSGAKVEIKWYDNGGDPAKMLRNAQLMVQDKPDAIIMYPVSTATAGIGQIFARSKIPCVSVNLDTPNCSFLNIDNRALGEGTAQIIGKLAKEKGWNASNTTVLIGQNAVAGEQVNDCVRYFYSTIAPILGLDPVEPTSITPKTTKLGTTGIQFDSVSQLQPSFTAVKNLLPSIPADRNIILYTVNNDATTGALRALTDAGRAGNDKLLVGGLGGDTSGIGNLTKDPRWVAEGDIFVNEWGQYAVAMAQALAKGAKPPEKVTALPQVVVDKQTVTKYHEGGSVDVKQLPPLVPSNEYLKQGGFLQQVGNIEGL
jgi:ribose transport system substrate-binding protein